MQDAGVVLVAVISDIPVAMRELQARGVVGLDNGGDPVAQSPKARRYVNLDGEPSGDLFPLACLVRTTGKWATPVACSKQRLAMLVEHDLCVVIEQDQRSASIRNRLRAQQRTRHLELLSDEK